MVLYAALETFSLHKTFSVLAGTQRSAYARNANHENYTRSGADYNNHPRIIHPYIYDIYLSQPLRPRGSVCVMI